jgi:hypothetical protein
MSDKDLIFPEQQSAKAGTSSAAAHAKAPREPDAPAKDGADNRGRRPGATANGEVTGTGASAGGGGNPEDFDMDQAGGAGQNVPPIER